MKYNWSDEFFCLAYVKKNGLLLEKCIKPSYHVIEEALINNGFALQYVNIVELKFTDTQIDTLCKIAILQNPYSIQFINKITNNYDELINIVLKKCCNPISLIKFPNDICKEYSLTYNITLLKKDINNYIYIYLDKINEEEFNYIINNCNDDKLYMIIKNITTINPTLIKFINDYDLLRYLLNLNKLNIKYFDRTNKIQSLFLINDDEFINNFNLYDIITIKKHIYYNIHILHKLINKNKEDILFFCNISVETFKYIEITQDIIDCIKETQNTNWIKHIITFIITKNNINYNNVENDVIKKLFIELFSSIKDKEINDVFNEYINLLTSNYDKIHIDIIYYLIDNNIINYSFKYISTNDEITDCPVCADNINYFVSYNCDETHIICLKCSFLYKKCYFRCHNNGINKYLIKYINK